MFISYSTACVHITAYYREISQGVISDNLPYEKIGNAEPICIADQVPFDIPDSWEWVRLENVVEEISAGGDKPIVFSAKRSVKCQIPIFSNGEQNYGLYGFTDVARILKPSLTISARGTIGFSCVRLEPFVPIVRLITITPLLGLDLFYLQYVCSILLEKGAGTSIKQLTVPMVSPKLLPLPPLTEQQRIVSKIKELMPLVEEYDKAETKARELNTAFPDKLKKSILQEAVQGKLVAQDPTDEPASELLKRIAEEKKALIKAGKLKKGKNESYIFRRDNSHYEQLNGQERCIDDEIPFEIPDSWEWVRLGSIGDWGSGATPNRAISGYFNGTIPWLKTGDLNDGYISDIPEKITELALQKTSVRLNPIGSVLIAMYGATIGKLGILAVPATTNQACCACIPFEGVYNKYLFYFLMANKQVFIGRGEGGAQPNISKEKIVATLMPLPPLSEQQRIVAKIEELMPNIEKLAK